MTPSSEDRHVPASRSRTDRWKECLSQIRDRQGGLELTIARPQASEAVRNPRTGGDLIWRVRIIELTEDEIHVEMPCVMGEAVDLPAGVGLVGAMAIGQNRWMFHSRTLGRVKCSASGGRPGPTLLRISMPVGVERCQRRSFYRISTAEMNLPEVQCWTLLDPTSVGPAELANQAQVNAGLSGQAVQIDQEPALLPEVGPAFKGHLMNLGGGGAGLHIDRQDAGSIDRARLLWIRVDLRPEIPAPLGVTARIVHTHIDSAQNLYAGLAFEFGYNPGHKRFVTEQLTGYVQRIQQRLREAA